MKTIVDANKWRNNHFPDSILNRLEQNPDLKLSENSENRYPDNPW